MSTESHHYSQNKDKVYGWIKEFQETRNDDVQLKLVKHYEALVRSLSRKFSKGRAR